jgi:hypothetical protein
MQARKRALANAALLASCLHGFVSPLLRRFVISTSRVQTREPRLNSYFGVNWEIRWDVVQEKLPALKIRVQEILQDEERKH